MDVFTIQDMKDLMDQRGVCVSLYMPTHRVWNDIRKDPITLRNLLRRAEEDLAGAGLRGPELDALLAPARRLLDDSLFWRFSSDGLAMFMSRDMFRQVRLPLRFEELLTVTARFQIKPLLPLFTRNGRFYILALSQNTVRLFDATHYGLSEVEISTMPENMETVMAVEDVAEDTRHWAMRSNVGEYRTVSHSHTEDWGDIDHILRYSQAVDRGIHPILKGQNAPLVLAGVDYLHTVYHNANTYPFLVEQGISGSPDLVDVRDLHRKAWDIVSPLFQAQRKKAVERFMNSVGLGITSSRLEEIVPASEDGRIDTLFVNLDAHVWGTYNSRDRVIEKHDREQVGDGDLLDLAAVNTLRNGGTVYDTQGQEAPNHGPISALFRY
jgi:hypothetical protein